MYVIFVTSNYVVQLATVIPMTIKGRLRKSPFSSKPAFLFWDFDAIGYIFMGFATLFAVPFLKNKDSKNGYGIL